MSVHRRITLCLFVGALFLAAIPSVQAQKSKADSLARVLKAMRKDTARVTVLIALVNARLATQIASVYPVLPR